MAFASRGFPIWLKVSILLGSLGLYVAVSLVLYSDFGASAAVFLILPVILAAWLWGLWGGLVVGLLAFPLNPLLFSLVGYEPGLWSRLPAHFGLIVIGIIVGKLSDLAENLSREGIERERVEEMLREREERYHNLFEKAPDMMAVIDRDRAKGKILECNQTLAEALGRSKEEIVGGSWLDLYHPESRGLAEEAFASQALALSRGMAADRSSGANRNKFLPSERTLLRADGSTIPVHLQVVSIRDETGKTVAAQLTWRDISDLKQMQQELKKKQQELFASQKIETIGTLAGGIAHEFNNLLTGIRGYAQLLQKKIEPASAQNKDLLAILTCCDRAAALTGQLLTFSRKQDYNPEVFNLNSVIENACKMLEQLIGEDINLRFVAATDLDNVWADRGQMELVLMNLATNARDAMSHGGTLTFTTTNVTVDENYATKEAELKAGRYVVMVVTDTGCGMDEATRQRIFEPFFTTKDVGSGTGLGLSTVHGIVKQHDGYIWANSQLFEGTTFTLYLPSRDEELEERSEKATQSIPKGSEVILVAEDEQAVREPVKDVLEQLGYTVLSAGHAREAEELLMQHSGEIDLLLSDVVMPDQNGPALYERLIINRPSLKVLYMSGYAETMVDFINSSTPFLSKPFTHEILAQRVREVLDSKEMQDGRYRAKPNFRLNPQEDRNNDAKDTYPDSHRRR